MRDSNGRFDAHRLNPDERPKYLYTFYVTGTGHFPIDMLRYDRCWPSSGEDAARMVTDGIGYSTNELREMRKRRSIKMISYREPTVDRWFSFTWSVGRMSLGNGE